MTTQTFYRPDGVPRALSFTDRKIEKYLARIGFCEAPRYDIVTLEALHRAHLLTVPFENLDIHLNRKIVLEEHALFKKIVDGGRGAFVMNLTAYLLACWPD